MSYMISALLPTVAVLILIGVPNILKNLRLSRELKFTHVDINTLDHIVDTGYFKKIDTALKRLGFDRNKDFLVTGMIGDSYCRDYHDNDGTMALVTQIVTKNGETQKSAEFCAVFEKGGEIVAQHGQISPVAPARPEKDVHIFPGMENLEKLLAEFRGKLKERLSQGDSIKRIDPEKVFDYIQEDYTKDMTWNVEQGYMRLDEKTNQYLPTTRLAAAGVTNFLNPFTDNFTTSRFIKGYAAALTMTLGAPLIAHTGGVPHGYSLGTLNEYQEEFLPLAVTFIAAGIAIGAAFERKSLIWALLAVAPAMAIYGE